MIKSSFFIILSTLIKLVLGFVSVKLIAQSLGTNGFGKLGQFMSLISILGLISAGGISNGIISNVARLKNNSLRINKIISAGIWIGLGSSLITGSVLFVFSNSISYTLFKSYDYSLIIKLLSIVQFLTIFPVVFGGYLNGLQMNKQFSILTVISTFIGTVALYFLLQTFSFKGAMLGLTVLLILPGVFFYFYYKIYLTKRITIIKANEINKGYYNKLIKHSLMLILSAFLIPIVQMYTRNLIAKNSNWNDVGLWQAASKISETGLVFLNLIMVNYYLPEIGKNKTKKELSILFKKAFLILSPILIIYVTLVYFSRYFLIQTLFSSEFENAQKLILWQSIGDSLRVLCTVFGFIIVFKEKLKIYIFLESFLFLFMVLFSHFLIPKFGVIGANYSYFLSYLIVLIIGILIFNFQFLNKGKV